MDTSINPKNIATIPYHFISTLLNAYLAFDVSVAYDVAINVAKCTISGKLMQSGSGYFNQWKWALHNEIKG